MRIRIAKDGTVSVLDCGRRKDMRMALRKKHSLSRIAFATLLFFGPIGKLLAQSDWKKEWERTLQEAKKEGRIVVGIPARAELRKVLETVFKPQFGIDMELLTARGPQNASRIASEFKAGVKYFDAFIGGSGTYESLVYDGMAEPLAPNLILPEVREEKYWWGGHIWEDNVKTNRFLYSFIADAGTGGFWYNSNVAKPEELRSLDDFLNPKWKGKVGFLDPRTPGSGQSIWSFLWDIKERVTLENSSSKISLSVETGASSPTRWQKINSRSLSASAFTHSRVLSPPTCRLRNFPS
jgi:hypothetical protein